MRNPKCRLCPLHKGARTVCIDGSGPEDADILLVGQNPGRLEDRDGKPFVGQSGKIIRSEVAKAGLDTLKVRYTNAVRCVTPGNRAPTPAEMKACRPYLEAEITAVKPRYVVTAGAPATKAVLKKAKISTAHGQFISASSLSQGQAATTFTGYPIYHPAATLRDPSKLTVIGQDLARLKRQIDGTLGKTQDAFSYRVVHGQDDLSLFWKTFEEAEYFSFDTETSSLFVHSSQFRVRCLAIGIHKQVWVIPLEMPGSMYENDHQRQSVFMRVLCRRAVGKTAVSFHGKYDNNALYRAYRVRLENAFDAMLAHHIIDENQDHDLKYISRIELDCVEYDIPKSLKISDNPKWFELMQLPENREKYWSYNARDAWNTLYLYYKFSRALRRNQQLRRLLYRLVMPASKALEHIECEGLPLNRTRYSEVEERTKLDKLESALKLGKIAKREINWNSPDQVAGVLYAELGLPVKVRTPTGKPSTSEPAIVDLKGEHPVINELLRYRELDKILGTYLEGWKEFIVKGRLFFSYKQTGTVTGRFSSRLHSIPTESGIRSIVDPDETLGWKFVQLDLSQAELRIAAELSGDLGLVDAYRQGRDVHWDTVLYMIGAGHMAGYAEQAHGTARAIRRRNSSDALTSLSTSLDTLRAAGVDKCVAIWKGWKEARTKAKRINFGFLYGMYENKFIEKAKVDYDWNCTWKEAHGFRTGFFELRPGLLGWHARCKKLARLDGFVTNMFGRIRRLPALNSTDKEAKSEAERQAVNSPVQGTIGDWKSAAMIEIDETIDKKRFRLCGEHHDALLGLVRIGHEDEVLPQARKILERPKLLKTFKINMKVPMIADINVGPWGAGSNYRDPH